MATGSRIETIERGKAKGESGRSHSEGASSQADSARQVKFSGIGPTLVAFC
jgi:hypothetical protein